MGHDDAGEGDRADVLGADVVALLRGGEQGVQHLDRRLEHLDEFEHALVGAVEAAGIAVGVGIGLRERFQPADVDLADEAGDVLVVLVAGLGLRDGDLAQPRGAELDHLEAGDVAAEFVQALDAPRTHQAGQASARNSVSVFELRAHGFGIEQPERALEHRRDLVAGLEHVNGITLHQRLEALGQRRLAAAHGPEQVEDLLALLQPLRGVAEEGDDALHRFFHAVEVGKGGVDADGAVHEDAPEARILGRVNDLRFTDRRQDALGRVGVHHRIFAATAQILNKRHLGRTAGVVGPREGVEEIIHQRQVSMLGRRTESPVAGFRTCEAAYAIGAPVFGQALQHPATNSFMRRFRHMRR